MKKTPNFKINKRVVEKDSINKSDDSLGNEEIFKYYKLKEKLKINLKEDIYNKIETMKILKEINDKKYYKFDDYQTFSQFIKDYKLARTQVYAYLAIAEGLEKEIISEKFIVDNGIMNTYFYLPLSNENKKLHNVNPLKPLRFQLKNKEAFKFFKKNIKFASFLLEKIYFNNKELLLKEYEEFNNNKKK